jgi:phosphoribosylanthranilate isomerase
LGWKGGEIPELQELEPVKVTKISSDKVIARAKAQADALQLTGEEREKAIQAVEEYIKAAKAEEEAQSEVTKSEEAYNKVLEESGKIIDKEIKKGKDWGVLLSEVGSAAAALTGSFAAMKGAVDIW